MSRYEESAAADTPRNRATLSVEEAAQILGIGRSAAYEAVHQGQIPYLRIGRRILIPRRALTALLDGTNQLGAPEDGCLQPTLGTGELA